MRIFEITDSNKCSAIMHDLKFEFTYDYNEVTRLFNDIMKRKIPNYAYMSLPTFKSLYNDLNEFLSNTEIYPDENDDDLDKLIADAHQMLSEIDNMISAMRRANLIK